MKRFFILSVAAVLFGLAFVSCSKEFDGPANVVEGLPLKSLTFTFSSPEKCELNMSKASAQVEGNVQSLTLFFYPAGAGSENEKPVYTVSTSASNCSIEEVSRNETTGLFKYSATVTDLESTSLKTGNYYLYAVANEDSGFCEVDEDLRKLTRKGFEEFCVLKNNADLDIVGSSVAMAGRYEEDGLVTLDQVDADNVLEGTIHLRRVVAKVTFTLVNGTGVDFTPKSYQIFNLPISATLLERKGWAPANNKSSEDYSKGSYLAAGPLVRTTNQEDPYLNTVEFFNLKDRSFSFYTLENVQNPTASLSSWTYNDREAWDSENDNHKYESRKFTYAPENATFVLIRGYYQDGTYSGDVQYLIHLGDFSASSGSNDNFTLRRNFDYRYRVTVNGVNKIIAEARREETPYQNGAEGQIIKHENAFVQEVDSHYEAVMLKLKNPGEVDAVSVQITTPYEDLIQNNEEAVPVQFSDYKWIQFGCPSSSTAFKAYNPSDVCYVYDLISEMKAAGGLTRGTHPHYIVNNDGYVYITAYIDEYYYERLQEIDEGSGVVVGNEIFRNRKNTWALSKFINAPNRVMTVTFSSIERSEDGRSTYADNVLFQLSQKAIFTVADLSTSSSTQVSYFPIGVETIEEQKTAAYLASDNNDPISTTDDFDGRANTLKSIIVGSNWDSYVSTANNGYINGQVTDSPANGSYPLSYCATRNRDLNGNGKVDNDEVRWYLPAADQTKVLWYGSVGLSDEQKMNSGERYFTSTNGDWRVWWAPEGSAYGSYYQTRSKKDGLVRCVRTLNDDFASGTITNTFDERYTPAEAEGKLVINIHSLNEASYRLSSLKGEYSEHYVNDPQDKLPHYLQFAKSDVGTANMTTVLTKSPCANYSETDGGEDKGYWRVPNEKELCLLVKYLNSGSISITNNGNTVTYSRLSTNTPCRSKYIRSNGAESLPYLNSNRYITTDAQYRPNTFNVRCVRDYTPNSGTMQ